ncbi:hypothetical protein PTKIN_Ptkin13bG0014500 [Pterospermum kingtungense]
MDVGVADKLRQLEETINKLSDAMISNRNEPLATILIDPSSKDVIATMMERIVVVWRKNDPCFHQSWLNWSFPDSWVKIQQCSAQELNSSSIIKLH